MTDDRIERGAAEDATDTPVTPTDIRAAEEPPSQGPGQPGGDDGETDRDDD